MKKDRLLNPAILQAVASLGHTEYLCIGDCGLPEPKGVQVIDVSVAAGIPHFIDVLRTISDELVVESAIVATEIKDMNPSTLRQIGDILGNCPITDVAHEDFKMMMSKAKYVIRTGETSPYANIILIGGVNF